MAQEARDWSTRNRVNEICSVCLDLYDTLEYDLLIDMANQHPPQIVKSKGFLSSLKKVFRSQRVPTSRSNSPLPPTAPADLAPTVPTITTDPKEAAKLRAKYTHFRILVIGRANAGKTTLLKRVCNSKEDPVHSKVRYQLHLI
jgi:ribosome biogenesis GTPase A